MKAKITQTIGVVMTGVGSSMDVDELIGIVFIGIIVIAGLGIIGLGLRWERREK